MTVRNMTYEGLAQAIADSVNDEIKNTVNLGDNISASIVDQMIMDRACEETPDYLDHYDVADYAKPLVEYDWIGC
jgi:hypothetical protein